MAINYAKFFAPTVLTTTVATIYAGFTAPGNQILRGGRIRLTNTTTSSITPTVYAVPNAGTAGVGNSFFNATLGPLQSIDVDVPILAAGDTIQAKCDTATACTMQAMNGGLFS
jgi:hypothetical protein